jgi:DNA-binding transcriptional LysR family regulator
VRVLPGYEPASLGIHAVTLSRRNRPLALQLLLDFLAARFGGDSAAWDRGLA